MINRITLFLVASTAAKILAQDVSHHRPLTRRYKDALTSCESPRPGHILQKVEIALDR
ncbi:MAG TPA: hypothetical protein VGG97_22575 [Bryobacteraceae bacterium]